MEKKELRKVMLAERCQFSLEDVEASSVKICEQYFAGFSPDKPTTVHVFLPILKHREIDTWQIIRLLWEKFPQCRVAVPITNFQTHELEHYIITPETEIKENHWGIPEPVNAQQISEAEIDVILLPLLAFDMRGHRLGYGKGYYDRFLAKCRPETVRIGLSLLPPVPEIKGTHEGDKLLHYCITPEKQYTF